MIKTGIFSAALAAVLLAGVSGTAEAKRLNKPYFAFEDYPFGEHCMRFGSHLHCSGPNFGRPGPHDPGYAFTHRLSCDEARFRVRERGFKKVVAKDCSGKSYVFTGRKNGHRYAIKINAHTGRMKISGL